MPANRIGAMPCRRNAAGQRRGGGKGAAGHEVSRTAIGEAFTLHATQKTRTMIIKGRYGLPLTEAFRFHTAARFTVIHLRPNSCDPWESA